MRPVRAESLKDRRNVTKMYHGQKLLQAKLGRLFFLLCCRHWITRNILSKTDGPENLSSGKAEICFRRL